MNRFYRCKEIPTDGLKPRQQHDKERILEIIAAIERYVMVDKSIPIGWINELSDLVD